MAAKWILKGLSLGRNALLDLSTQAVSVTRAAYQSAIADHGIQKALHSPDVSRSFALIFHIFTFVRHLVMRLVDAQDLPPPPI